MSLPPSRVRAVWMSFIEWAQYFFILVASQWCESFGSNKSFVQHFIQSNQIFGGQFIRCDCCSPLRENEVVDGNSNQRSFKLKAKIEAYLIHCKRNSELSICISRKDQCSTIALLFSWLCIALKLFILYLKWGLRLSMTVGVQIIVADLLVWRGHGLWNDLLRQVNLGLHSENKNKIQNAIDRLQGRLSRVGTRCH